MIILGAAILVVLLVTPRLGRRLDPQAARAVTVSLAIGAALLAGATLALLLWGPSYQTSVISIDSSGQETTSTGSRSLMDVGLQPLTAVVIVMEVIAFAALGVGAVAHARGRRWGRVLMLIAVVPPSVVGFISFGLAGLIPAVAMAVAATTLAFTRPRPESRDADTESVRASPANHGG